MSNIQTFQNLEAPAPYQGQAVSDFLDNIREMAGKYEFQSDGLLLSINALLSNTAVAVKATAGKVYAVMVVSPAAATLGVNVWVYTVAAAGVNVGVSIPRAMVFCPAGETIVEELFSGGSANRYATAIAVAATADTSLSAAVATANQPTVTLLYA
jgi:hypothetical protein